MSVSEVQAMAEKAEDLKARPVDLVPVAIGAFEEAWRVRGHSGALLIVVSRFAQDEAEFRLAEAPGRNARDALSLAWGMVSPIVERLMARHGFLKSTVADLLAEATGQVEHVSGEGGGE